ncbi:protein co-occurring with transport systems [Gracilibacillus boraciitolerans JCM 21714]|uniref:Protein co-occurring with transport systems n=1 Tax=Gracilibacillus boraciitolerans JCM 21714 TaxID=1298598 RepID=W4VPI7_9BACI|nr:YigZ family protein [Gracilibacillus boraciitolerans]GAE95076.1 protein co-occurring with transport systems [Gracilibacillus boraciitolerans JCM 21714]
MINEYFTVNLEGSAEQMIQKSRFIGHVKRVTTEQEAQDFIQLIKKRYADATHNCSAYMIGEQDHIQKANDDGGEPNGTAGVPILEVLKKKALKDTAVVITRYFGGIKLGGGGGLIRAYSSTATLAIDTTGVVERIRMRNFEVTLDYTLLGKLENEIRQSSYLLEEIEYLDKVIIHVRVKIGAENTFTALIADLTSGSADIKAKENSYIEIDVTNR